MANHAVTFIANAVTYEGNDCLLWPFAKLRSGYGAVCLINSRRVLTASRYVCELAHGEAPSPKHDAAHSCGVKLCVNPQHLRWATRSENNEDMVTQGKDIRGSKHPSAKLTTAQVLAIRADTRTHQKIADEYGISAGRVSMLKSHKAWSWLE